MIFCHRSQFESTCERRGYSVANSLACVVARNGDLWSVDETHPAYPRRTSSASAFSQPAPPPPPTRGPGTELSRLLKRFGIEPTPTCKCRAKAAEMDAWGCDECSKPERIDEVVAVMREEAKARGLPFLDAAGRVLVKRAISNARKAEARRAKEAQPAESGPA